MELRDRGAASTKTRYSSNGPGLWTRRASNDVPTHEPRNRTETNSLSPQRRSKRKREVDNMRPTRNRPIVVKTDLADNTSNSQAQSGMSSSQTPPRGPVPGSRNEGISNEAESSHGETSDGGTNGKRYSFSNQKLDEPTFLDRIKVLPEMRDIPWREGQTLPPERSTESQRVQQRGACMVATRGRVMTKPCTHCESGYGRFSQCIVLEEWFQGACATCIFTSKGNKCSLRIKHLGNQDARALRYANTTDPPSMKRKRSEFEKSSGSTEDDNSIFNRLNSPGHYVSPYPPLPSIPRPPLKTPGMKEAQEAELDSMLQAQIAREELDQGNMDEGEAVGNTQQARAAPIKMLRPRLGPAPTNKPPVEHLPPPIQNRPVDQQVHNIPNEQILRHAIPVFNPQMINSHMMERSVISQASKSTQKQLFTVVSGVQGGLQQLQSQLELLKSVIGWDAGDEEPQAARRNGRFG